MRELVRRLFRKFHQVRGAAKGLLKVIYKYLFY
jgi:hypothetical protein